MIPKQILLNWMTHCQQSENPPWEPEIIKDHMGKELWTGRIKTSIGSMDQSVWDVCQDNMNTPLTLSNVRFVAMARTAVPLLVEEILELRDMIVELEAKINE